MAVWQAGLEDVVKEKEEEHPSVWQGRNVFVTGCTGLLGAWLVNRLHELGAQVVVLIRDGVPQSNFYLLGLDRETNIVHGDLTDCGLLCRVLNEYETEVVFHLGAQTIVGTANRSPLSTFESNVQGTWNVLEAARISSLVTGTVVASSDKAYGEHEKLPYGESAPLQGRHPYDVSKSCADLIAQSYFHTYGLPVVITRCGNLYGGGDLNFNRIVPGTIRSVLRGEPPVIRSDGQYVRDYFFVQDAVEACLHVAEKMEDQSLHGQAFNLSSEQPVAVLDLVEQILALMGRPDLKPKILNQAKGEIPHQYLSSRKAKKLLGWQSRYGLEEGLREAIQWYQEFFDEKVSWL